MLSLERNDLDDAAGAAHEYVDQIQEDAVRIFALGFLARVYVELGQLQAAEEILRQGMTIRKKMARVLAVSRRNLPARQADVRARMHR